MAEATNIQTQPFYLKKAKLKGYKSIKDAEIEFHDGLNIIIGKNASGKSNLLEILYKTLKLSTDNRFPTNAKLTLGGLKDLKIDATYNLNNKLKTTIRNGSKQTEFKFVYENQPIEESEIADVNFIKYNIPNFKNYTIISNPFSFKYYVNNRFADIEVDSIGSEFLLYIIFEISTSPQLTFFSKSLNLSEFKIQFVSFLDEKLNELNRLFDSFTPIEKVRFNPYINIHFEEGADILTFSNLFIEYKIKGNWLPYSSLSDGTKRLFYIISELYTNPNSWSISKSYETDTRSNIIFIEEPELGIHPHQLHRLMTFIKEQAEDKQIILSTHSPMVLDVLDKDELHRIIIASNDDTKKGSQFRHLTEAEMDKARSYMNDQYLYLSDYWKHSDLE